MKLMLEKHSRDVFMSNKPDVYMLINLNKNYEEIMKTMRKTLKEKKRKEKKCAHDIKKNRLTC